MSSRKISIKKNFIYNITYEVFRLIVPLLSTPYISRVLGADGVGTYALAFTYSQYFILFAGLGFSTYAARELAYVRDDKKKFHSTFIEIFASRVILLLAAICIYILWFFILHKQTDLSYRIALIYLIASVFDVSYYFRAIENFKTVALRNIFVKFIGMVVVFCLVKRPTHVWLYTLILAVSELIGQMIMIFSVEKSMWRILNIRMACIKKHLTGALALFIPALAVQMYTMLDKVMIGHICGETETGYYENAQKMVRLAATISSAIVAVSVPRMSYFFANGFKQECKTYFKKVFVTVSFLVFPMCFGLIGVADSFSYWYFGKNFSGIQNLIMLGAPLIISLGWSSILGNMILIASGKQKYYTIAVYIGAVLNVGINFAMIPKLGASGAMIGSIIAEFAGMFLMLYFCKRQFSYSLPIKNIIHYLFSSIIMLLIVRLFSYCGLNRTWFHTCINVLAGIGIYFFSLILFKDDWVINTWNEFHDYIRRRRNG